MAQSEGESLEEAVQNLQYMQQLYQNQYTELSREINSIIGYVNELNASKESLEKFEKLKNSNSLSPIGSSVFVHSKISDSENVLVSVGAGYLVEKDAKGASDYISSRIELQTKNMQELIKARNKTEDALFDLAAKLEKLLKQA
ncbi:MAG: prefoldin subunit alpha [Candidatus Marsarchaeota archaeon]|nr:prefoldin subunit alpha [Candidatus Marsarchaeota archaeon]